LGLVYTLQAKTLRIEWTLHMNLSFIQLAHPLQPVITYRGWEHKLLVMKRKDIHVA